MSIGTTIKALRAERKLSQAEVAKKIGVDRSAVAQWENDIFQPRIGNIRKLAAFFNTSISALIDDEPTYQAKDLRRIPSVRLHSLGKVHAGTFTDEDSDSGYVEVPVDVLKSHPKGSVVVIEGDCMNRVAPEGTAVLFNPAIEPNNGDITICETEDHETVVRRWHRIGNTLLLVADSDQHFDDIIITGETTIRLIGTVVWIDSPKESEPTT